MSCHWPINEQTVCGAVWGLEHVLNKVQKTRCPIYVPYSWFLACPFILICHLKNSISVLSLTMHRHSPPVHVVWPYVCQWAVYHMRSRLSSQASGIYTQKSLALPDGFQAHTSLQTFPQLTARGASVRKKIMSNANSLDLPAMRQILLRRQILKSHQLALYMDKMQHNPAYLICLCLLNISTDADLWSR